MTAFTESTIEDAALAWLEAIGCRVAHGPDIAPDMPMAERADYGEVVLVQRLRDALARLNPDLPAEALEDAFRKLTRPEGADLIHRNRALQRLIVDGVTVEYRDAEGAIRGAQARVFDFEDPANNDWLAVNQFTVTESRGERPFAPTRRPDVVLFVNGLPLAVLELKNAADEDATIWTAFQQLATYKSEIPSLFATNAVLVVSDGVEARVGTLTAGREWFKPLRTIEREQLAGSQMPELQVVLEGIFAPRRFLDLVRDFIVFEDDGSGRLAKKMAGYHQFHAVQVAMRETLRAAELASADRVAETAGHYEAGRKPGGNPGDRRVGVVWHTQGSGKSLTMAFYAGRIIREPAMGNPTIGVLTDRNDLDDQLFSTFSRCKDLLRQPPVQAESRAHLRELLSVEAGGVVFTTIHKFMPPAAAPSPQPDGCPSPTGRGDDGGEGPLSRRRNIVVIADEAHRSQYDFIDGFARHMRDALPNASFIGFTGTPIEKADANTRAVFGDYISIYDIQRAVADGATVPIYYESRLARLALDEAERPKIDPDFEEATEGEEVERKEKLKTKWAQLEAIVGAEKPSLEGWPKYITNYIAWKQKLVDWIWKHTTEGVSLVADALYSSAVVAYMYKTKGLPVMANDQLYYCYHVARAIIENDYTRLSDPRPTWPISLTPRCGLFDQQLRKILPHRGRADDLVALADHCRGLQDQALRGRPQDTDPKFNHAQLCYFSDPCRFPIVFRPLLRQVLLGSEESQNEKSAVLVGNVGV